MCFSLCSLQVVTNKPSLCCISAPLLIPSLCPSLNHMLSVSCRVPLQPPLGKCLCPDMSLPLQPPEGECPLLYLLSFCVLTCLSPCSPPACVSCSAAFFLCPNKSFHLHSPEGEWPSLCHFLSMFWQAPPSAVPTLCLSLLYSSSSTHSLSCSSILISCLFPSHVPVVKLSRLIPCVVYCHSSLADKLVTLKILFIVAKIYVNICVNILSIIQQCCAENTIIYQ